MCIRDSGQWELVETLRGKFGDADADIIRNIVMSWMAEKSIISTSVKLGLENSSRNENNINSNRKQERTPQQIDTEEG